MTSISVVIPTYHRYEALERTIQGLLNQTVPPDQIIVVDNTSQESRKKPDFFASTDSTECIYVSSSQTGKVNAARNEGLERVTSTFVLYFDDDMDVPRNCIENFLNLHEEGWDAVTGVIYEKGRVFDSSEIVPNRPLWSVLRTQHGPRKGTTIGVPSGFICVRTSKLISIGGFDESYIYNYDDYDLGLRLWRIGCLVVRDPRIQVTHLKAPSGGGRAITDAARRLNKYTAKYYFLSKHFNRRATRVELFTDIILSISDLKLKPVKLLRELSIIYKASLLYTKYNQSAEHKIRAFNQVLNSEKTN